MTGEVPGPRHLDDADREAVAAAITDERERTRDRIAGLERDLETIVTVSLDENTDDEHDPEGATIAFERAQVTALLDDARRHLDALEQAEQRLATGTFGRCEVCDRAIPIERLLARPATTRCVDCARTVGV